MKKKQEIQNADRKKQEKNKCVISKDFPVGENHVIHTTNPPREIDIHSEFQDMLKVVCISKSSISQQPLANP